jgi:hypothetical protein
LLRFFFDPDTVPCAKTAPLIVSSRRLAYARSKEVRKLVGRVLTVLNSNKRDYLREQYAGKK